MTDEHIRPPVVRNVTLTPDEAARRAAIRQYERASDRLRDRETSCLLAGLDEYADWYGRMDKRVLRAYLAELQEPDRHAAVERLLDDPRADA